MRIFVTTPFGKVRVVDAGPSESPNVVLALHGDGREASGVIWYPIVDPLVALGFRVIIPDMPGYGESDGIRTVYHSHPENVIQSLLAGLKIRRKPIIVGRAVGGRSALSYAASFPKVVRAIVLCHPVAPSERCFTQIRCPSLLSWAKDDVAGQPYSGPHGASYFVLKLGCDLVSWKEADFNSPSEYYSGLFCERVSEFVSTVARRPARPLQPAGPAPLFVVVGEVPQEETVLASEELEAAAPPPPADEPPQVPEETRAPGPAAHPQPLPSEPCDEDFDNQVEAVPERPAETVDAPECGAQPCHGGDGLEHLYLNVYMDWTIHVAAAGSPDGYPIVAMHGDGKKSSWRAWQAIMVPLASRGYRVYAVDMPGYGDSTGSQDAFRRDGEGVLNSVIQHLKLTRLVLIGRSVGGRTALCYAHRHPALVRLLVLTHPVIPPAAVVAGVQQPVLLTWAKDDSLGHPYAGPHGVAYFVSKMGCDVLSWREADYPGVDEFYKGPYCDRVLSFLRQHRKKLHA